MRKLAQPASAATYTCWMNVLHIVKPVRASCWICGSDSNLTREHFPKKADTRGYFLMAGRLYRTDAGTRNEILQGPGATSLTLGAPICARCNNELTQPYDRAWDQLRAYLLAKWPAVVAAGEFELLKVFPRDTAAQVCNLHLYFVKVLGCVIVEHALPIPLEGFIDALLHRRPHRHLHLLFAEASEEDARKVAFYISDMHARLDNATGKLCTAQWLYAWPPGSVQLLYALPNCPWRPAAEAWHPSGGKTVVRMGPPVLGD